jgi:hypothetical protein
MSYNMAIFPINLQMYDIFNHVFSVEVSTVLHVPMICMYVIYTFHEH